MKNILFIGIFHETNCFIKEKTKLKDFEILKKKEILDLANDFSQISGFLNFCKNKNLNDFPTVSFTATPSGIVENKVFEIFWKKFIKIFNRSSRKVRHWIKPRLNKLSGFICDFFKIITRQHSNVNIFHFRQN